MNETEHDHERARRPGWGSAMLYLVLIALSGLMLLPFLWMLRSSLCDDREVVRALERFRDFVPQTMHPGNYGEVFRAVPFWKYLLNSTIVSGSVVLGTVLSSSLCAYAFAFCRTPYRRHIFYGVLATMMLPGVVMLVPTFVLFRWLGWIDTLKPLIIPAFCGNAFAIFLFRQFFLGLPGELIEVARIDGATNMDIFWKVIMPLSRPVTITVAIFSFMGTWNDFMGPLIFLNSQENWTLQLGLSSFQGQVAEQLNLLMACAVMVLLPVLAVFFCLQRYFIRAWEGVSVPLSTGEGVSWVIDSA